MNLHFHFFKKKVQIVSDIIEEPLVYLAFISIYILSWKNLQWKTSVQSQLFNLKEYLFHREQIMQWYSA